jgi:hypothetical protein
MFINSKEVEWKDITAYINGKRIVKIREIARKKMTDKEALYAEGDKPFSVQSGNKSYEGSITVLVGALDDLNIAAIAAGGEDITDVSFDIVYSFRPRGIRALKTVLIEGAEIKEYEERMKQGDKFAEVTLPFIAMDIKTARG